MNHDLGAIITRTVVAGIAMLFFTGWCLYWYKNAPKLDDNMTKDWLAQKMGIERIPKGNRIESFRRSLIYPLALALISMYFFISNLLELAPRVFSK